MTTEIACASTPEQLDATRDLIRAFVAWHRERHHEDIDLIERYFDAETFKQELADLPGKYAAPAGRLLLATLDGNPAGCVALRALDAGRCEMKRMFVYPRYQRQGVGRALAETLIREARAIGYTSMFLDTSVRQVEAVNLYQRLGFVRIDPYYELSPDLEKWLIFMRLSL